MVSEGILRRNTPKVGNLFECVAIARMEDEKGSVWPEILSACEFVCVGSVWKVEELGRCQQKSGGALINPTQSG